MWMWLLVFVGGFLVGSLSLVALEALGVYVLIKRLNRNIQQQEAKSSSSNSSLRELDPQQSLDCAFNKKGVVWVLEADKISKNWLVEKAQNEQKRKKEVFEVTPVQKYAKVKDRSFVLTDLDGSTTAIPLKGCIIEAVSATNFASRKWAKRFPLKLESRTSVIYSGSKTVYIFLETSWEKESWCKALRLASCDDKETLNWFTKLNEDFHCYLTCLNAGYPLFMKPSLGFNADQIDKVNRLDGSASKVRLFWKRLAKMASKNVVENRGTSSLGREDRKVNDKHHSLVEPVLATSLVKTTPKATINSEEENMALPSSASLSRAASQSHVSALSGLDSDEKFNIDEGTLCWNLLISRLFFDAKSNAEMKSLVQMRIQRTLFNMRTPSYIGEVLCTDLDLGNLPPHIHGIRVLPTDMNEVWAWEVDIEYCGGVVLDIETRVEVHDLDLPKGMVDTNPESSSVADVTSDLLEGFEYLGKKLNFSEVTEDVQRAKDEGDPKLDGLINTTSCMPTSTSISRWKSILNSIAKQVSQVPLCLSIRVASLRGTVRLHIKPPPSDQLWFGFTLMPDIEFNLESSVGEHKITSGRIALFLISRFKAAIRETMVLPNCESVCIPWMLAEKNDWVPRKVAPFIWLNQEATSDHATLHEGFSFQPDEAKTKMEASGGSSSDHGESKHQTRSNAECSQQLISDSWDSLPCSLSPTKPPIQSSKPLQEATIPLLSRGEPQETCQQSGGIASESQSPSRSMRHSEIQNHAVEEEGPKRMGRRARMLDLGKKMGEKLEEKRRHIEEKGRNIVEKMRGP